MECPKCYDEEIHGVGVGRIVTKKHLSMDELGFADGHNHFQCPRCGMTRKQKAGFLSSGPIENSTLEEAKEAFENKSVAGAVVGVLLVGVAVAAALAGEKK